MSKITHQKQAWLIVIGALLGGFCGWFWGPQMGAIAFLGEIFLNALKMVVIPLVMASIIVGICSLGDIRKLGGVGGKTFLYYLATTSIAVLLGLLLVNLIQPGEGAAISKAIPLESPAGAMTLKDIIVSFIPANIIQAMVEVKILPLIIFSLLFGGVLTTLGEKAKPLVNIISIVNDAILKLVGLILWFAPVGVFALVATQLGASGGGDAFFKDVMKVGEYALTVAIGLAIHGFIILPLILSVFARRNPFQYFLGMMDALVMAFSTASSAATLPVTFKGVKEKNKVPEAAADFVLPIGATINMDGTALYEAVAAMFIAQAWGVDLGFTAQLVIFITATLASIGAAGIPQAGLVTMILVLQAVGLPLEGIGLLLSIDWFLDRLRTTVNVWGDSVGAAVIAHTKEIQSAS